MPTEIVAKLILAGISLTMKLMTESFIARVAIIAMDAWSKTTKPDWDDKVTAAVAKAFDIPLDSLTPKP